MIALYRKIIYILGIFAEKKGLHLWINNIRIWKVIILDLHYFAFYVEYDKEK